MCGMSFAKKKKRRGKRPDSRGAGKGLSAVKKKADMMMLRAGGKKGDWLTSKKDARP